MDSGPTTLPTPNFSMYNQENCQLNDDGRLSQINKTNRSSKYIPPPPPLPNQLNHPSLLVNNTYTIKKELRNNHHFLAQANNDETSSLNFINSNNPNLKLRKKNNLEKNCQPKTNPIVGQFDNLNSLNNLTSLNNCNQTPANVYPTDNNQDNSLSEFQNYSMQHVDMPNQSNNNFFSLPYHQANFHQYNQQETCVKYPQLNSMTVDRQNFHNNQRNNCVNTHCQTSGHKKNSSFLDQPTNQQQPLTQEFNQAENFNNNLNLSNSMEDLRNDDQNSKQQQIDDRTLQPNLISALRTSISSEKQRLYKEQLRNELALKLKIKNQFQTQTNNLSNYFYRKKPKYKFFSQLYFLFHISFTLCLFKVSGKFLNVSILY